MNADKTYNEYQTCPKCDYRYIAVVYCNGDDPLCQVVSDIPEHLHLTCERCSYEWAQKPVRV